MMRLGLFMVAFWVNIFVYAQGPFSPRVGLDGCSAVHKDSVIIRFWGDSLAVYPSWQNMADTSLGMVSFGSAVNAKGMADNQVVSLGDGGSIIYYFDPPISDHSGYEFAVFENGFNDYFLELAFVEVSDDGENFIRFENESLTTTSTQTGPFDSLNTSYINNLAGKYRAGFGTPFDLYQLQGLVDINHIVAVKIIDVIGSIDTAFSSTDAKGQIINDPWPTPFFSSGFDVDALAVLYDLETLNSKQQSDKLSKMRVSPNPNAGNFSVVSPPFNGLSLFSVTGHCVYKADLAAMHTNYAFSLNLSRGVYQMVFLEDGLPVGCAKMVIQ